MSFKFANASSTLGEITYKRKKSLHEKSSTSTEAEAKADIQVKNVRVGKHRDSGLNYLLLAFAVQLDTPAFFLYMEGIFKAEVVSSSKDEIQDTEDYRKRISEFVHANHQALVEDGIKRAIDSVLLLTPTPPT